MCNTVSYMVKDDEAGNIVTLVGDVLKSHAQSRQVCKNHAYHLLIKQTCLWYVI